MLNDSLVVLMYGYPIGFLSVDSVEVGLIVVHQRFTDMQDIVLAHSAL